MKWITRGRPKIDRIACPWLILRFIDQDAEFIFVPDDSVIATAERIGGIPFDVPNVEHTHYGDDCTFDYFLKKYKLKERALQELAVIVRGADTDRHELAEQAAGLWAISVGLAHNIPDDHQLLEKGMVIYDALYSWAKYHRNEQHTSHPVERSLLEVFHQFLNAEAVGPKKKIPVWVEALKAIIQDQVATSLTLKEIAKALEVNPVYLSRVFSKYFEGLSFGAYIQKLRVEKAVKLLEDTAYNLTDIAYHCGFSDQSHFNRVFKKHIGETPLSFRKKLSKSTFGSKG